MPYFKIDNKCNVNWFNKKCEIAKKERNKAWRNYKNRVNGRNREKYVKARNDYIQIRREEESKYEERIVSKCKEEPKMFYKFINRKLKTKEGVVRLKQGEIRYENDRDLANVLNKNFQTVFTEEEDFIELNKIQIERNIGEIKVDKKEIRKLIENLDGNKAMGPDEVAGRVLKECKEELIKPLYDIINCSVNTGRVPMEWKRANIVPIYKSGNKEDPMNYRPVSLTSIVCKLCETVIKNQWTEYLERNNVISGRQFGFQKGKSCVTNLICFYSRVIDIIQERDGWADCIYLDLKKAFDKVPHKRLLWKLKNKGGLDGKILKWMENYLMGRQMRTVVRGEKSGWVGVKSGVPQGSVLAPVLFVIYINDMPEGVNSYINMFADDAKMMRKVTHERDCEELERDLERVHEWSRKWGMEFNAKKCHVMEMGLSKNRPRRIYRLGEEELKVSRHERDLGISIQDNLSPERHINKLFGESYKMLQNIGMAFHYMNKDMMKKIIVTLIRPKLEYASVVWSPHRKKDIYKLERIQRIATKMVPELRNLEYMDRLKEMELPTLEERRVRGDMITLYKLINGMDVLDREDLLLPARAQGLRGHGKKLRKDTCRRDVKKYSFPQRSIEKWNSLSAEVVGAVSVKQMKERLDGSRTGDGTNRA